MYENFQFSIDSKSFYDLRGFFNPSKKELSFELDIEQFFKILKVTVAEALFDSDKIYKTLKTVYIKTDDNRIFSCINCIFTYNISSDMAKKESFKLVSTDVILENEISEKFDINTKKVVFKTKYLSSSKYMSYIKNIKFKYDSNKSVELNIYKKEDTIIEISISSTRLHNYNKLSKIIYTILEMITLIIGDMPIIDEVYFYVGDKKSNIYFSVVDKYNPEHKKKNCVDVLGYITEETINKKTIDDFINFRKKTKIIYDLFLININRPNYKEIVNCNFVQMIEGLYKSLISTKDNLVDELKYFYYRTKNAKRILSTRDKRRIKSNEQTEIFIYKAKNQRHYLSHLNSNENKNVFYGLENIYAYWKLSLAIRLFILDYLDIKYDNNLLKNYIDKVNKWAKDNKLRYSLKLNEN